MKILIYGSTFVTQLVVEALQKEHEVIGYVPSKKPIFAGDINLPVVEPNHDQYDIALSVQYDQKITDTERVYNLHTGLLPEYGGCDILYHTLKNGDPFQGLTFHTITEDYDRGGVVAKVYYPVFAWDTMLDLYKRVCALAPHFALSAINLLPTVLSRHLPVQEPKIYRRGQIDDKAMYEIGFEQISAYVNAERIIRRP